MNEKEKNVYNLLGLAKRAGKIVAGEELVIQSIRSKKSFLILITEDASENTFKKVTDKCRTYGIDWIRFGTGEKLGHAMGKERRVVIGIMDKGFAAAIQKAYDRVKNGGD